MLLSSGAPGTVGKFPITDTTSPRTRVRSFAVALPSPVAVARRPPLELGQHSATVAGRGLRRLAGGGEGRGRAPLLGPCAARAARWVGLHTGIGAPRAGASHPRGGLSRMMASGTGVAAGGRASWKAGVLRSGTAYVLRPGVRATRCRSPPPVTTRGQRAHAGGRGTPALRACRPAWSARHADGVRDGGARKGGKLGTVDGQYTRRIPTLSHPLRHHSARSPPTAAPSTGNPSFTGQGSSGEV